jgi:site-specific DNA recombinase
MKNKKIVAIYYRTSKISKNDSRMQKAICKDYCKRKNIKLFKEYQDSAISGLVKNRPALKELLQDIDQNKIKKVIVYKIDRLGRESVYLNELFSLFEKKNVELSSASQNFDTKTPEGIFFFKMLTLLSEFESKIASRRAIDGRRCLKNI